MDQEYFSNRKCEDEKKSTGTVETQRNLEDTTGSTVTIEEPSLSEGISQFIYAGKVEGKAEKTLSQYDYVFEKFTTFVGEDPPLGEITPSVVRSFLKLLMDEDLSKATIAIHYRVLSALFNWLVGEDLLEKSPTKNIQEPKTPKIYPKVLNEEEVQKMLSAVRVRSQRWTGVRNYTILLCFIELGLRLSELINAELKDLKINKNSLHVTGKGNKERIVSFGPTLGKQIRKWLRIRTQLSEIYDNTIFISKTGERLTARNVQRTITRIQKWAGLSDKKVSPHVLRHTSATLSAKNGMNTFQLQRFYGWENLKTALKYVHLSGRDLQEAILEASPIENMQNKV